MKRKLFYVLAVLIISALCLGGCMNAEYYLTSMDDEVLASLGKYDSREYYTSGGFQDYTDYAIYKYNDVNLEENGFFEHITAGNKIELIDYIENFEGWIETIGESDSENEVVKAYNFSADLITEDDYVYIEDRCATDDLYEKFENYNVYFFDTGTNTLHYFHNNI